MDNYKKDLEKLYLDAKRLRHAIPDTRENYRLNSALTTAVDRIGEAYSLYIRLELDERT